MTPSLLVTMKGTTTIPKQVRNELGIKSGDRVHFEMNKDGDYVLRKDLTLEEVRIMNEKYTKNAPKRTIQEEKQFIQEGRAKEAVERYRRSLS